MYKIKGDDSLKALNDIKILDLSEKLTVNLATMYLSSFGADVTKLEKPQKGDTARLWQPLKNNKSIYFNFLNGGKKSITLDITTPEGKEILKKIVPLYDVLCVSYKPGFMDSMGLGYEDLKKIKSDIIYASYTYFGESGPLKNKPGSSIVVQAKSVAMDMTGVINEYPVQAAPSIAEHYAAGYFAAGIVMAVADKKKRGIGQKLDISLQDSMFSCIEAAPAAYSTIGEVHTRKGNFDPSCAPYDTFETCDGYVAVGCATQPQWGKFCDALGFEDLKNDSRFVDNEGRRTEYLHVLRPLLAEKIIKLKKDYVEEKCCALGIPCSGVMNIQEITDMPNTHENGFTTKFISEKLGNLIYPTIPFELSKTPADSFKDAPKVGENTKEILEHAGLNIDTLKKLSDENII